MSELLARQCNAAIPFIDVGTDVFAFRDDREEVARIQVKSAAGSKYKLAPGFKAPFRVPMRQLRRADSPPMFYALAVRLESTWAAFIVIGRAQLQGLWNEGCGRENSTSGDLELDIKILEGIGPGGSIATCGQFDLSKNISAWESLPPLKPVAPVEALQP